MKALGYDGILFSSINVTGGIEVGASGPNRRPLTVSRLSSTPLPAGMEQDVRQFVATFLPKKGYATEATLMQLLGALNLESPEERPFQALLNDGTTYVTCQLSVGTYRWVNTNELQVQFNASNPKWAALTDTSVTIPADGTAPSGVTVAPLVNAGGAQVSPEITITAVTQRSSTSSNTGWQYYRTVTIENGSTEAWTDELVTILLGDTAAWVTAAKAQSAGQDIRVRYQGQEYYRTLVNFNTKYSLCHVLVSMEAGASKTLEIWYGNPSAEAPAVTLSTENGTKTSYAAPDLEGDTATCTNASTSSRIYVTGKSWEAHRWRGGWMGIVVGTGSTRWRRVNDNGNDYLDLNRSLNTAPDATSTIVLWKSGVMKDGGRVTGGIGANSFQDTGHTIKWGTDQLEGATVVFETAPANPATYTVTSNTPDTITLSPSYTTPPGVGDAYTIHLYGAYSYAIDTSLQTPVHLGVARINHYTSAPGTIWPGKLTPFGWGPDTRLDNNDAFAAWRPYDLGAQGGNSHNYRYLPRIARTVAQADAPDLDDFEGEGDSFSTYSPQGFKGIYFDYLFKNKRQVGKFVFSCREVGSEDWRDAIIDDRLSAGFTTVAAQYVDLTAFNNPNRLMFSVLPFSGNAIPTNLTDEMTLTAVGGSSATDSDQDWETNYWQGAIATFDSSSDADPKSLAVGSNTPTKLTFKQSFTTRPAIGDLAKLSREVSIHDLAEMRSNDWLDVYIDLTTHPALVASLYTVGSEVAVYDMHQVLRLGGGTNGTPPFDTITVGGSGHYLAIPIGDKLQVSMDPGDASPIATILDGSNNFVARAPWAVQIRRSVYDIDGNEADIRPPQLFPLRPAINQMPNGNFDSTINFDLNDWFAHGTTGGVTVTYSQSATFTHSADGLSLRMAISAAPAGAWHAYLQNQQAMSIPVETMTDVGLWVYSTNVSLQAYLEVIFKTGLTSSTSTYTYTFPAANTWYAIGLGDVIPEDVEGSSYGTVWVSIGVVSNGVHTGSIYFDDLSIGPPNLYISESHMGGISVAASFREGWHS